MTAAAFVAGAALAYSGLAALCLAMDRHYADVHGRGKEPDPRTRLTLRLLGWIGIGLSFAACVAGDGWKIGPICWLGTLTASAIVLVLLASYAPRIATRAVLPLCVAAAVICLGLI